MKKKHITPTKFQLIYPFFAILFLHFLAIFFFTRGFLLTRTELPHSSKCSDIFDSPCFDSSYSSNSSDKCWTKPSIDRLVIIVFDALRFDFVAPSSFFPEKKPWMDKLPIIQKLAAAIGSSSRIFKAIADPPTTSLQRLKGLTTGGLPTFIDVGNSFGAPAIVEDNFIQQLVENGKRIVMMGDDTWLQLFPHHFNRSFPYPSFNVKDLDTVDNGCIEHLVPSLNEGNWDVLIAHFLGVDHAGHIFGVDTIPMIQKLEQYNKIVEEVVEALKSQSGPGGLHENTLLVVMGDHGQTLNGDHGGGSPEEVETSIFAMSFNNATIALPPELDSVSCGLNVEAKQLCIGTIEQLDFAATLSALLGVPFPFGSIGRVNPQLYALGSGIIPSQGIEVEDHESNFEVMKFMQHYVNALCINAWQVKRYIDAYSTSSVIGFPSEDFLHVKDMYSLAQENWLDAIKSSVSNTNESSLPSLPTIKRQIEMYVQFLDSVVGLARSKWTEFNLNLMVFGFSIILFSLIVQVVFIKRVGKFYESSLSDKFPRPSIALVFSFFAVIIRACSFLSNSYILEEGKVAIFFWGTSAILQLRYSFKMGKMVFEAASLIMLVTTFRFILEFGVSKQASNSSTIASMIGIAQDNPFYISLSLCVPILSLFLLAYILLKFIHNSTRKLHKHVISTTIMCYMLIASHWILDTELFNLHSTILYIGRSYIPRVIYAVGIFQLVALVVNQLSFSERILDGQNDLTSKIVAMLSSWSSIIILLSGNQGSIVALVVVGAAFCITRLENLWQITTNGTSSYISFYSLPTTQWSLLAVTLFFCTGHWCAFDGLRYSAAFVGFDEFMLVRQAILLSIETFGFSHILPIFGLPILVTQKHSSNQKRQSKLSLSLQLCQVYLIYNCIITTSVAFTILCVTIQRRHLMVWGLFAPKYVFDVVGLILIDVLICLGSLYFIDPKEDEFKENCGSKKIF